MQRITRRLGHRLLALALLELTATLAAAQTPRQVAAPASDIVAGIVRLPDPASTPTTSRSALVPLVFERTDEGAWHANVVVPIDRAGDVALALLSPDAGTWTLFVGIEGGVPRAIGEAFAHERRTGPAGDELAGWVVDRYDLRGAPAGTWNLRVEARGTAAPAPGWLLARGASELAIEAHVTTQELVGGRVIGVVTRTRGEDGARVERARLVLEVAGTSSEIAMHDDGRHEDAAAGDGLFGALVPDTIRGDVRARVEITGTTAERAAFLRAVQLSFPVLEPRLMLEEAATARLADARRLDVAIAALPLAPRTRLHVSAEVWGRDANGASVPVCWLSRQLEPGEPSGRAGTWSLGLALDTRWLDVARAHEPLELRAVRVQDPDTDVVLDALDRIPLVLESPLPPLGETREITPEMLTGSSSLTLGSIAPGGPLAPIGPTAIKPALMLVHGYCSGGSIWPAADFTQPKVVFLDPDENRTHDQFAQLLDQKAQATGLSSFGVVAHSQGGAAALHLFTYYASGLDLASGGRRIQSLATPYQGTPLASLGGFLCGVNNDMTPSGSATWLAGIPSWARAEVWYWTTSNSGSACQFLTDFLLTNPEDGTVEQFRGQLPGAHSMGHSTGWCHTTGMSNPASYTDHVRNQAMNAAAAR